MLVKIPVVLPQARCNVWARLEGSPPPSTATQDSGEREIKIRRKYVKIYDCIKHIAKKEVWLRAIVFISKAGLEAITGHDFPLLLTILFALCFQLPPLLVRVL